MIESSEDLPVGEHTQIKWLRAESFLTSVRGMQRERGKGMSGRRFPSPAETSSVQNSLSDERLVRPVAVALDETDQVALRLFEHFGEMCRRNRVALPHGIRTEVHFILGVELLANAEHLGISPAKLIATTVYNGVLGLQETREFSDAFSETPYVFRVASTNYPSDPAGFLTHVIEQIAELKQDERFASFHDMPSAFQRAAIGYPSDPKKFLLDVLSKVAELEQDERFTVFRDTPGVFRMAAINHPSDSERFLVGVIGKVASLEQDERFAAFRDSPNVYRLAAAKHSDPESFLLGVTAKIDELERDDRFEVLRDTPHAFKHAAVNYPSAPEAFLLDVIAKVAGLEQDERFAAFREIPSTFKRAAIGYPSDPESFLATIAKNHTTKGDRRR